MILAMQSSVVSADSHSIFPSLLTLHSSHLSRSWWLSAHHFSVLDSSCELSAPVVQEKESKVKREASVFSGVYQCYMQIVEFISKKQT